MVLIIVYFVILNRTTDADFDAPQNKKLFLRVFSVTNIGRCRYIIYIRSYHTSNWIHKVSIQNSDFQMPCIYLVWTIYSMTLFISWILCSWNIHFVCTYLQNLKFAKNKFKFGICWPVQYKCNINNSTLCFKTHVGIRIGNSTRVYPYT